MSPNSLVSSKLILRLVTCIFHLVLCPILPGQSPNWNWIQPSEPTSDFVNASKIFSDSYGNIFHIIPYQNKSNSIVIWKFSTDGKVIAKHVLGYGRCFAVSQTGELFIADTYTSNIQINSQTLTNHGNTDFFIQKLDASFNPVWIKTFVNKGYAGIGGLTCSNDGDIYFTGAFEDSLLVDNVLLTDTQTLFVGKINSQGTLNWITNAPIINGTRHIGGEEIILASNSTLLIKTNSIPIGCVMYCGDQGLIRYTITGQYLDHVTKLVTHPEYIKELKTDKMGNIFCLTEYSWTTGTSNKIIKLGSGYKNTWTKFLGYTYSTLNITSAMAIDPNDQVWFIADIFGSPSGVDTVSLDSIFTKTRGKSDIVLSKISNKNGKYLEVHQIGGREVEIAEDVLFDSAGNCAISGICETGDTLWAGAEFYVPTEATRFVAKLKLTNNSYPNQITELSKFQAISSVFPNPSNGLCTITCPGSFKITFFDAKGSLVFETEANNSFTTEALNFSSGLYICLVATETGLETHKIIIDRNE